MRIVNLEQGSPEWKEWRNKGLGASNADILMLPAPKFMTKFELWGILTGLCERMPPNEFALAAMNRGKELEPGARARARAQMPHLTFMEVPPSACHDKLEFVRASFDDITTDLSHINEYKCPGKAAHAEAVAGNIPENYKWQMDQQFLVSGAKTGSYCSWDGVSDTVVIVPYNRDDLRIARLEAALIAFWQLVQTQQPPEVTLRDFVLGTTLVRDANKRMTAASKLLTMISEAAKTQKVKL